MKEEPEDIKSIFSEALEKQTPQERAAYLDKACGSDASLRAKVEALLKAHEQAGSFLDAPPFDPNVTLNTSPLTEGPGTIIGRYKLLEQIGEGGFGVVYMAEQQEPIRRRVALKIIKLGMDTKQVIARFEAERQALAMMDHPNIAGVLDAGATETGRPYFVMELVKGIPITEYCDKNNLDTRQRLELFIDVCKAVQHAHQKGIIHRDIKPSNVMITLHDGKPVPKVIDFGIAKATGHRLTEKTLFTKYAQMIGTPEYMSPEQAEMSGLDIDTRTDIYSLGVLLYELLTSATPFDAKELREAGYIQMQRIIRETEPLKPSTKLSTMGDALTDIAKHRQSSPALLPKLVRGDLDWIAMKTLEKDRTRRYETANELAMDIQRHLSNEPVEASPPSTLYRFRKLVQKHRRTVAAVITITATLIIGLVVSTSMYFLANQARRSETVARSKAEQSQKAEQEQRKLAETKAEDLRRSLYVNSIQLADSKYREGNIGRVRELLDTCPNDLRGWEWHRLNYISDQSIMTISGHQNIIHSIALSPDGKRIVSGGWGRNIKMWDAASGAELMTFSGHEDNVGSVAFSPDGKRLVSGSADKTVKLWDVESGTELMTLRGHDNDVWHVTFSPDGKRIASATYGKVIKIWDAIAGVEVTNIQHGGVYVGGLAFSPDGKYIASGDFGKICIWDANSGAESMTIPAAHKSWVMCVAYSPDGKHIVSCGGWDPKIKVWDASTGKEIMILRGRSQWVNCVSYDSNGRFIISGSQDNTIDVWDANTGDELMTLRGHHGPVRSALFSPNGKKIVSCSIDKTIKLWDVSTYKERMAIPVGTPRVRFYSISFSPDGKWMASGSDDYTVKVWDIATTTEVMTLCAHENPVLSVAFSPDGKRLVSGSADKTVKLWDVESGTELMTLRGHAKDVWHVTFSPDGKHIASADVEGTIRVWDAITSVEVMKINGHKRLVLSLTYSPDGAHIISASSDNTIKVWDVATGTEISTIKGGGDRIRDIAVSHNGKLVASADDQGMVKIYNAVTGSKLMTLSGHTLTVGSLSFSPDDKQLVSGGMDGTVKLWDTTTGAELMTIAERTGYMYSIAFSPDGKTIAAIGLEGIVLWETTKPAGGYEPRKNAETARKLVDELYQKYGFYYEVIDRLQHDKTLDEPVRKIALQIADSRKWEDADKLQKESWEIVSSPDKDAESYKLSLEKAERANSLEPNDLNILNTLGVAQYRVGAYEDALVTLTKTDKLRTGTDEKPEPANLAFTAMALHRLGRTEEAKAALERLRTLLKDERFAQDFAKDEEAKAYLAEAEKLIEPAPPKNDKDK